MEIVSLNNFQDNIIVNDYSKSTKKNEFKRITSKYYRFNFAIIVLSIFSLLITTFGSLFQPLLKIYYFMMVNRFVYAMITFSFTFHVWKFNRASIKIMLLFHLLNQANYFGITIKFITLRIPAILYESILNSTILCNIFSILCFSSIIIMEIINLVFTCNLFFQVQNNLVLADSTINEKDLKSNLCTFILFGHCLVSDCLYLAFSIIAYADYTIFHGHYLEFILSSLSGTCIFITFTGLILIVSIINYLR